MYSGLHKSSVLLNSSWVEGTLEMYGDAVQSGEFALFNTSLIYPLGKNLTYIIQVTLPQGSQNITILSPGHYTIQNNTITWDKPVDQITIKFLPPSRDIAITNLTLARNNIGKGFSLPMNVTVQNLGPQTEIFNVTVYANMTAIATLTDITLIKGNFTTLTFAWNTSGFANGHYYIWAYAWPIQNEIEIENNNCTGGEVLITKVGDLGSRVGSTNTFGAFDGLVTSTDLNLFLQCYKGTAPPSYMYLGDLGSRVGSTNKFFVCDGLVTSTDLNLFLQCYKGQGP
jgi:hypothetical protein